MLAIEKEQNEHEAVRKVESKRLSDLEARRFALFGLSIPYVKGRFEASLKSCEVPKLKLGGDFPSATNEFSICSGRNQ